MLSFVYLLDSELVSVGSLGKSVGLRGGIRVFLLTDFPEIMCKNVTFYIKYIDVKPLISYLLDTSLSKDSICIDCNTDIFDPQCYIPLTLNAYNPHTKVLYWNQITSKNQSDFLRNVIFYSSISDTRKFCKLQENEFFYFDIIGMSVVENGEILGIVRDIQEIAHTYYFVLDADFLIPYIDRYVVKIDIHTKQIFTKDAQYLNPKIL